MSYVSRPVSDARVPTQRAMGHWGSSVMLCSSFGDVYLARPTGGGRRALGDTSAPTSSDGIKELQRQVNRFTQAGGAPMGWQVGAAPLPITGTIDQDTATRALWVMQLRAGANELAWKDQDSKKLVTEALGAWSNPISFVTANLERVTNVIHSFADLKKIPAAKGASLIPGLTPTIVTAALTIGALVLIMKGGRK